MNENENTTYQKSWVKVAQLCPTLWPRELYSPWNSPSKNTGVGSLSFLHRIFPTRGRSEVCCITDGFLPAEPQEKTKNTGVGSLSLFQGIFPTQESNRGLLHCRQILYQPSYDGLPLNQCLEDNLYLQTPIQKWKISNCYIDNCFPLKRHMLKF